jgi:hypothetical protein
MEKNLGRPRHLHHIRRRLDCFSHLLGLWTFMARMGLQLLVLDQRLFFHFNTFKKYSISQKVVPLYIYYQNSILQSRSKFRARIDCAVQLCGPVPHPCRRPLFTAYCITDAGMVVAGVRQRPPTRARRVTQPSPMLNPRSIYQTADRDRSSTPLVSDDDASFAHASTPWLAGASPRPFLLVLEAFFRDDARMACRIHTTPHWGQWDTHGHRQPGPSPRCVLGAQGHEAINQPSHGSRRPSR